MVSEDCDSTKKVQVHSGAASDETKAPHTIDQPKSAEVAKAAKTEDFIHRSRQFDLSKAFADMEKEEQAEKMARRESLKRRQAQRAMIRAFGDMGDSESD